ncbi:LppU/SCO3897 family protein [Pseudonocardia lacus]|jgi:hypothetical protein|uniref:LppU/SCO3897 family protein n=1 Tax=Pseudonocardia lacus TaxID=2835865 RepID=UPI001BDD540A|nr:hypothetical protein [Pseudonocardia lacus]
MTGSAAGSPGGGDEPAGADDEVTRVVPRGSEEVTRHLRKPGRDGGPDVSGEVTRDLRRSVLRRFGPPSGPGRARPGGTPSARPRRAPPEPAVERDEFGLPRARFTPPGPVPPAPTPGRPGTALIAVGVVVGLLFLGVAGLGLWVILGAGSGGTSAADLATGDCVSVAETGAESGPTVEPADCGSPRANFKVVGTGSTTATCPGDVDNAFTQVADGAPAVAVCLDIDWVEGDCFDLSATPVRVDCAAPPGSRTVRAAETLRGTVDAGECSTGAGLPYDVRDFIVCAREL